MKNKKLFAILTLVCFMFTLMPVAAFATEVEKYYYAEVTGDTVVKGGTDNVSLAIETNDTTTSYYVFAYKDGVYDSKFGLQTETFAKNAESGLFEAKVSVQYPGDYKMYVVDRNAETEKVMANENLLNSEKAAKMLADTNKVVMSYNDVTVTAAKVVYDIEYVDYKLNQAGAVEADNGFTAATLTIKVVNKDTKRPIPNADVTVYTDSYGLQATKLQGKTNAAGKLEVLVTATMKGTFTVYAEYGDCTKAVKTVTVNSVGAEDVEVLAAPQAPIYNATAKAEKSGIKFQFTDANGAIVGPSDYKVTLVSAPAGVNKKVALKLIPATDIAGNVVAGWVVTNADDSELLLPVNGEYTFKVALQNGDSATASVTVADFDKTVAIMFVNAPKTIAYDALNADVDGDYIVAVDANGVSKPVGATVSVNGKAVKDFDGALDLKADDDLIGSTVTVIAVYKEGNKTFTTTNEMTVVDAAASIAYANATAEVGKNATLFASIVDANGKATSITTISAIEIIILDKPANAVVSATDTDALNANGKIEVSFLASAAGDYKLQTIVTTTDGKYISGIETITVGGGEGTFKDVVVMSIGAANIVVNSDVKAIAAAPMIQDGRTFVPFRALAEAFGAEVEWVEATQSVVAELNGVKVVMNIGANAYTVNGAAKTADVAPFINGASTMVPVRFVAEAFGINVTPIAAADGSIADVLFAK